jgi:hypothetical protein
MVQQMRITIRDMVPWLRGCVPLLTITMILSSSNCCPAADSDAELVLLPQTAVLNGPLSELTLLPVLRRSDRFIGQPTGEPRWTSSDQQVAVVDDGFVVAKAVGTVTITVQYGDQRSSAKIRVAEVQSPPQWSFQNHVLPVLTKAGCNSGSCHGALAGKGGFRLSLRGYNPSRDHFNITKQSRGRRVELANPAASLFLVKPTGIVPHKGGVRLKAESLDFKIITDWLADGTAAPTENDAKLVELEILPGTSLLGKGDKQQLLVRGTYSNGCIEDVTRWCKFSSADESVAEVDDQGKITIVGHGIGAITAWFSSQIVIARVVVPYANSLAENTFSEEPRANFIDRLVVEQLKLLRLPPAPLCDDSTFIRRVYLDTIGKLPSSEEVTAFLADTKADKRDRVIESLMARPEFVDYWTYKWSDLLLLNGTRLRPAAVKAYYEWIQGHVRNNTPWDQFVREVLTAQGSTIENGATNFYALHQSPEDLTENASQAFLGLSIGCAKCHNHPLEKWTNDQYYAMANLFARVRGKGWGGDSRNGDGKRTVYVVSHGDLVQPRTGRPQPPTPLDGEPLSFDDPQDRRKYLADWMTSMDNPYFGRAIANRVWANFFGVGLVESVDDLRISNPASNEKLLTAAADYLADHNYDLKVLMRAILKSRTYQRSSLAAAGTEGDQRYYSRYFPRRLMAEVLLDAISDVTDVPTAFNEIVFPGADRKKTDFYPPGTRALQLYDSAVDSYFLKTFGRNQRRITCECERSDEPTMVQVLHMSNGDTINQKLDAEKSMVSELLNEKLTSRQMVERVYLAALSRQPGPEETKKLVALIDEAPEDERRLAVEDLFWAVLTSREFVFNH